jgi:diguanylate cyclase (GGDEF)-like protein/PAS domain S-box-containing protein
MGQEIENARHQFVDALPEGMLVLDLQNRVVDINPAACRLLACQAAQALGQPAGVVLARWPGLLARYRDVFQVQEEVALDAHTWLDLRIFPLLDPQARPQGRIIMFSDITARKQAEAALTESEARLRLAQGVAGLGSWELDLVHNRLTWSEEIYRLFELDPTYFGASYEAFLNAVHPDDRALVDAAYTQSLQAKVPYAITHRLLMPDGRIKYVQEHGKTFYAADGRPLHSIGTVQDITERQQTEVALQASEAEACKLADELGMVNRISLAITAGLDLEALLQTLYEQCQLLGPVDCFYVALYDPTSDLISYPLFYDLGARKQIADRSLAGSPGLTGYVIRQRQTLYLPDTLNLPPELGITVVRTGGSPTRAYLAVPLILQDQVIGVISMQGYQVAVYSADQVHILEMLATQAAIAVQNARLYAEVQRLALVDPLTGLYNRRGLFEFGAREITRVQRFRRPLSVLFVDIDHFKQFNDCYSYAVGDQVLVAVAHCLRSHVREVDLAARYGGEEFVVLLPEITLADAVLVAERLRAAVAALRTLTPQGEVGVTVSIGVSTFIPTTDPLVNRPGRGQQLLSATLEQAGQMLHVAKASGRNCVAS